MKTPHFSLVIPTFNRAPILRRMLSHLLTVDGIDGCEILVIDDGSTDDTASVLEAFQQPDPARRRVITVTNGGPARARNAGVAAATNDRILFIDDDVFPRADMLHQHWKMLENGYDGSQGVLVWHPEIEHTPLIAYIDSRGSQFAFDQVENTEDLSGKYIYTGNFAVRRALILQAGGFCDSMFNRELAFSAFEDTLLGHALKKRGARLVLNRLAVADHLHHMSEKGFLRREYNVGSGLAQLQTQFPEVVNELDLNHRGRSIPVQLKLLAALNALPFLQKVLGYPASMRLRHREAFLRGFQHYQTSARAKEPRRPS